MPNAVIVADMTRAFLEKGHILYIGDKGRRIIPNVQRLLERELSLGSKIFFVCDNHDLDDLEFKMFPPHSIKGTSETEIIPELAKYPGEYVPKRRYSVFFETGLDEKLKALKPDKVIICGVLTNICVLHSTADARNRDYNVEVPIDCVASSDEKQHKWALEHIEKVLGARLTSVGGAK